MKDISHWIHIGYGGKSTLEKEELINPETEETYLIKYPRQPKKGVSWEDLTELIAAEVGKLLGLKMMDVEIVKRNNRRGSLLKNFIPKGIISEEGGVLLSTLSEYESFLETDLKGYHLIYKGFKLMQELNFWHQIKSNFIQMNIFDILIGNQDRHPFNWMVFFNSIDEVEFSPIYDNGASLGFRFDDKTLLEYIKNENKLSKYMRDSKVKAGLFERKKVKSMEMLHYLKKHYYNESLEMIKRIENFNYHKYESFINQNKILSSIQKEWLKLIISFRSKAILQWFQEGE